MKEKKAKEKEDFLDEPTTENDDESVEFLDEDFEEDIDEEKS